jgi:hypothetical protein
MASAASWNSASAAGSHATQPRSPEPQRGTERGPVVELLQDCLRLGAELVAAFVLALTPRVRRRRDERSRPPSFVCAL